MMTIKMKTHLYKYMYTQSIVLILLVSLVVPNIGSGSREARVQLPLVVYQGGLAPWYDIWHFT